MKSKKIFGFLLLFIIIAIIAIAIVFFVKNTKVDPFNADISARGGVTTLWSFEYTAENGQPSVISFLLILDTETHQVGVLEIPANLAVYDSHRDAYVPVENYYTDGSYAKYHEALQNSIGAKHLEYIFMDKKMLSNFVDFIGGIQLFIIEENSAVAAEQDASGTQVGNVSFDGPDAATYLQSLETSGDDLLTRSSKRKEMIIAMLSKLQSSFGMLQHDIVIKRFLSMVYTSFSRDNMRTFNSVFPDYAVDKLFYQRINGSVRTVKISNETRQMLFINSEVGSIARIVDFFKKQIKNSGAQIVQANVTITILNGTVINGLARRARDTYEASGFNVLSVGNASRNDVQQTSIIDRVGNKSFATLVAKVIGVRNIITDISTVDTAGADITLILGDDFDGERVAQ